MISKKINNLDTNLIIIEKSRLLHNKAQIIKKHDSNKQDSYGLFRVSCLALNTAFIKISFLS